MLLDEFFNLPQIFEKTSNPKDVVAMDVPFLIRALEYAREDAKGDLDLHNAVERMLSAAKSGEPLDMNDYALVFGQEQVDEEQDYNPVASAIARRIMSRRVDLLKKYGPVYVTQAIDDVADSVNIGPDDEIGSSDVSAWVRAVERNLQSKLNQYDEPMDDGDALDETISSNFSLNRASRGDETHREPAWSFQEIAQKLGIPVSALNLLAFKTIGGFPEAIPGISARHGSKKYYKRSEVKHWVNANKVREKLQQKINETFGSNYAERLAQRVYDENPELDTSGMADELLDVAFPFMVQDLGSRKRANYMLNYDEDFPSDFVSAYAYLKQGGAAHVAEESTLDKLRNKLSDQGYTSTVDQRLADRDRHNEYMDRLHRSKMDQLDRRDRADDAYTDYVAGRWDDIKARNRRADDDHYQTMDMFRDRLNRYQYGTQRDVDPEQLAQIANIKYQPTKKGSKVKEDKKFPEPRKATAIELRTGGTASKSETLGKDGMVYHWQDPRAKQGVAEAFANPGFGSTGTSRGAKRIANTVRKALAKNAETPEQRAARKDFEARHDAKMAAKKGVAEGTGDSTTIAQALDSLLNKGADYPKAVEFVAKKFNTHPEYVVRAYEEWGNFEHDDTFDEGVAEGFADDFAAFAKERGGVLRHGPQPAKPAAAPAAPQPTAPVDRAALSAELKQLQSQFDPQYQYSDDYSFWSKQDAIAKRIDGIKKQLGESRKNRQKLLSEILNKK